MSEDVDLDPMLERYRRALAENDDTARAVDWRDEGVSNRNFAAVAEVFARERNPFTVYEVGCGVGALADFLRLHVPAARYSGCDIMPEMVERARLRDPSLDVEVRDILTSPPPERSFDYVVVSGAFNLRMDNDPREWEQLIERILVASFAIARKGFASNFLTGHVEWKREHGHYQDPARIFDFAMKNLSRFCELRHSYYPWEFALFVYRKPVALPFGPPPVEWSRGAS